jgi:hypothetical protein
VEEVSAVAKASPGASMNPTAAAPPMESDDSTRPARGCKKATENSGEM